MREKHYRVWDKENKMMGYARDLLHVAGMFRELYDACEPGETFPDGYVLMEGIGLKDKNGKEIYGGDIVKHPLYGNCKVIYRYGGFGVNMDSFGLPDGFNSFSTISAGYDKCEVIGNIYEDANLLSKDK